MYRNIQELINNINNGFALINYIGHGTNQSWGDEKYLDKSRDLASLNVKNNKLAIWVAGTCSFGNYYENNSFMEELLIKEDGAIAIIATTDGIHYTSNWQFLKNLFGKNVFWSIQNEFMSQFFFIFRFESSNFFPVK